MLGENQDAHITFASSRNFATRVSTESTMIPPCRFGGSVDASVVSGEVWFSTPRSARVEGIEGLFLRLHDVRQRGIARLVQAQIGGDHRRQLEAQRFMPAVDSRGSRLPTPGVDLNLGGKRRLRPAEQVRPASGRSARCRHRWPVCRGSPDRPALSSPRPCRVFATVSGSTSPSACTSKARGRPRLPWRCAKYPAPGRCR